MSTNKSYNVKVSSSRASDKIEFNSSAQTWEELERDLINNNINVSNMSIFKTPGLVQLGNIPFTPIQNDPLNPVDIVLVLSPLKMKSGGYIEDREFIKQCFSEKNTNSHYNSVFQNEEKSYTRMNKEELQNLVIKLKSNQNYSSDADISSALNQELPKSFSIENAVFEINQKLDFIINLLSKNKSLNSIQKEIEQLDNETRQLLDYLK